MPQCVDVTPEGYLVVSAESPQQCTGYMVITQNEYQLWYETVQIDPSEVLAVFGIVFGWVIFLGYLSYNVKVARNVVNKA